MQCRICGDDSDYRTDQVKGKLENKIMNALSCFKAYDIRGKLGDELDESIAYRIGRAYGMFLGESKTVVVGSDVRPTSESLKLALANGLMDAGINVVDLGMTGTEEVYFATFYLGMDGGIEVTASHNPMDYNGMKLVREGAKPSRMQGGYMNDKDNGEYYG